MGKLKKWILLALMTSLSATLAVACGDKGGNTGAINSSQPQSSESVDASESGDSSDVIDNSESGDSSDGGEVHTHITEGEWKHSTAGHWLVCTCGELVQYSGHSGTAVDCESQPVCDVCKIPYGKASGHTYGELSDGENGKAYYCDCGAYVTNDDLVDFIVEVDDEPVVLQLSDTQVVSYGDSVENQCYRYVREVVEKTNPDLIILTGDIVYGRFDPNGALLTSLINFMEGLDIPWAPVFGNHDNESLMGVDWQCAQLEAAENCLFKQGEVTGNGNYSVGLENADGELLRVFYMMDSNGCGQPMCDANGVQTAPVFGTNSVKTSAGFGSNQVLWFTDSVKAIHKVDADVKISMAYHIQPTIFHDAFRKYDEYTGVTEGGTSSILKEPLNLDTMETADETDFGFLGRTTKGPWSDSSLTISKLKELGVDSIFVGHEHCNSVSIVYEGIRFQYGQKSSTYDRYNTFTKEGEIFGGYMNEHPAGAIPLMGGTVIPVSVEDGTITKGYICYYGDPFGANNEEPAPEPEPEPEPNPVHVEGLQYGTDLTAQSDNSSASGSVQAVAYDENTNAYYIVSGTSYNRMYINVGLLKGKTTVTFDILVPEEATTTAGAATQEFAIRVKPNQTDETMPGVASGYLWYDASYTGERKVIIGEWQTITIDISGFADVCTEFGIYFVEGNNGAYIKNVAVS